MSIKVNLTKFLFLHKFDIVNCVSNKYFWLDRCSKILYFSIDKFLFNFLLIE